MITGANIRDIKKSQAGCKCLTKGGEGGVFDKLEAFKANYVFKL